MAKAMCSPSSRLPLTWIASELALLARAKFARGYAPVTTGGNSLQVDDRFEYGEDRIVSLGMVRGMVFVAVAARSTG